MPNEKRGRSCFPHPPMPTEPVDLGPPRVIERKPHVEDVRRQIEEEEGKEWASSREVTLHPRLDRCFVVLPRDRDRAKDAEYFRQVEAMLEREDS